MYTVITRYIQGPAGTLNSPTGTGFIHVTGGTIDGAARAVNIGSNGAGGDVTGTLALANFDHTGNAYNVLQMNSAGSAPIWGPVPVTPVQYLTGASSSKQIVMSGPVQVVGLDTSTAGGFIAKMPVGMQDGVGVELTDDTFSFGTTPGEWSVLAGTNIEDPRSPGVSQAGPYTVTSPASNGVAYRYWWLAGKTLWKLAS